MFFKNESPTYKATLKMKRQWQKYVAITKMAEYYVKENNDKRARQAFIDAEIQREKFWEFVYDVYTKLKGKKLSYNELTNEVTDTTLDI